MRVLAEQWEASEAEYENRLVCPPVLSKGIYSTKISTATDDGKLTNHATVLPIQAVTAEHHTKESNPAFSLLLQELGCFLCQNDQAEQTEDHKQSNQQNPVPPPVVGVRVEQIEDDAVAVFLSGPCARVELGNAH